MTKYARVKRAYFMPIIAHFYAKFSVPTVGAAFNLLNTAYQRRWASFSSIGSVIRWI